MTGEPHDRGVKADGGYFDGIAVTRHEVCLTILAATLHIEGDGIERSYPLDGVSVSSAVGSIRRTIRLQDGSICEVTNADFLRELENRLGTGSRAGLLHLWEKSLTLVAATLVTTALIVLLFMRFGVPAMARQAAFAMPLSVEKSMGGESLAVLDRIFTTPTKLSLARRAELTALFQRIAATSGTPPGYRLEFRNGRSIGANAFALPSGIVIITDQLVELARHDDEIAAILAHELGHVRQRHVLRHVLQNSATVLIMATLTGDLVSITSLAATLPTALVDASFSRGFEREADDAAIAWMKSAGVSPRRYAEILGRLQAELDARHGAVTAGDNPMRNYLSTHPDTGERIRRIMNGKADLMKAARQGN